MGGGPARSLEVGNWLGGDDLELRVAGLPPVEMDARDFGFGMSVKQLNELALDDLVLGLAESGLVRDARVGGV